MIPPWCRGNNKSSFRATLSSESGRDRRNCVDARPAIDSIITSCRSSPSFVSRSCQDLDDLFNSFPFAFGVMSSVICYYYSTASGCFLLHFCMLQESERNRFLIGALPVIFSVCCPVLGFHPHVCSNDASSREATITVLSSVVSSCWDSQFDVCGVRVEITGRVPVRKKTKPKRPREMPRFLPAMEVLHWTILN
jgi:hypothetical protein